MNRIIQMSILLGALVITQGCQYVPEVSWLQSKPSDAMITKEVLNVLNQDPELTNIQFHVETSEGIVYLSGYVKTIRESDEALRISSQVSGVKRVENNIIVRK